jgi:hypothetical protein
MHRHHATPSGTTDLHQSDAFATSQRRQSRRILHASKLTVMGVCTRRHTDSAIAHDTSASAAAASARRRCTRASATHDRVDHILSRNTPTTPHNAYQCAQHLAQSALRTHARRPRPLCNHHTQQRSARSLKHTPHHSAKLRQQHAHATA